MVIGWSWLPHGWSWLTCDPRTTYSWRPWTSHSHLLHATHLLHAHASHALNVLGRQVSFAVLLPLSQSHVQGLGYNDATIHLGHSFSSLLGGRKTNKTKALRPPLFTHDLGAGDSTVRRELL